MMRNTHNSSLCLALLMVPSLALAAGPPGGMDVTVVNSPLPVTGSLEANVSGSVQVSNLPAVQQVTGTVDAIVVDMPEVGVRRLDDPALSATLDGATVTLEGPFVGVYGTPLGEVPEGTRLVVEHVSVDCSTPSGNPVALASISVTRRTSPTSTVARSFQIPLGFQGTEPFGGAHYIGALSTRLYSDRGLVGGGVTVGAARSAAGDATVCQFAVSGHTVPLDSVGSASLALAPRAASSQEEKVMIVSPTGGLSPDLTNPPEGTIVKLLAP